MEVKHGEQVRPKKQPVQMELATCPLRVTFWSTVQSPWQGKPITRNVWFVEVRVLGVDWEPWLLLTDWPVTGAQSAVRIFIMYRQRALCGGQFQMSQNLPGLGRSPSKITLLRGLSRLLEILATQAILSSYATQHQGLTPNITALLHGW